MFDITIEIIRVFFTAFIVYYLYSRISRAGIWYNGWRYIFAGFCFMLFASLLDITDNIPGLEKYIIIGDTVPQAILEKICGYLLSSALILIGFIKLVPLHAQLLQTRKDLQHKEALYRDLVQSVNSVILRWDNKGRIIFLNEFGQKLFGYTMDELMGRHVMGTIVAPSDTNGRNLAFMIDDILTHPENYELNENENICSDGTKVFLQWSNRAIRDEQGRLKEILSVGTDITRRKQLEEELRQAQKMEAIGNLAGGIAHDFNNILSGIMGYTELAQLDTKKDNHIAGYLEQIYVGTQRAKNLVKQILAFTRKSTGEKEPVQVASIVAEAMKLIRSSIPSTITIQEEIDTEACVMADPGQIHQIVMNLATNAFHAMERSGGILHISLKEVSIGQEHDLVTQEKLAPGRYVELKVADTGMGIDEQAMTKIFDPYFSTKEKGKGTGLGLSVVLGIIKSLNGVILTESALGKGSVFRVFLPVIAETAHKERHSAMPEISTVGRGETVLFVDDEKTIRQLAQDFITQAGFRPICFENGIKALQWLSGGNECDIMVTDMTMPGMTGAELIEKVKIMRPDLPAILCTGHTIEIEGNQSPTLAFLNKPFSFPDLFSKIRSLLDQKEANTRKSGRSA